MSYKTMKQSQDWKKNYNWTDKNEHPVEDNEFQPKVLKDQPIVRIEDILGKNMDGLTTINNFDLSSVFFFGAFASFFFPVFFIFFCLI